MFLSPKIFLSLVVNHLLLIVVIYVLGLVPHVHRAVSRSGNRCFPFRLGLLCFVVGILVHIASSWFCLSLLLTFLTVSINHSLCLTLGYQIIQDIRGALGIAYLPLWLGSPLIILPIIIPLLIILMLCVRISRCLRWFNKCPGPPPMLFFELIRFASV